MSPAHDHVFGNDRRAPGERRTLAVLALTAVTMVAEIVAGALSGSVALAADGWHMGTHAAAFGVAVLAYRHARRHARDPRYTFGTGKVGDLAGFASAVALAVVALMIGYESAARLATPAPVDFDDALLVAVVGLLVNIVSAILLVGADGDGGHPGDGHHGDGHAHAHDHGSDHNLRGAYLHVLADALTSLLAIGALLAGLLLGWTWVDPLVGLVGGLVIARWAWTLLRDAGAVLVDLDPSPALREAVRDAVVAGTEDEVTDLHLWRVGRREHAAIIALRSATPSAPSDVRARLARWPQLVHVTIEVSAAGEA